MHTMNNYLWQQLFPVSEFFIQFSLFFQLYNSHTRTLVTEISEE